MLVSSDYNFLSLSDRTCIIIIFLAKGIPWEVCKYFFMFVSSINWNNNYFILQYTMYKNTKITTPIAFFIFNRPDKTKKVFEEIRKVKPSELFIIADGPRKNNDEDNHLCLETRDIVEKIDWDCKVQKDYSNNNIGLRKRVSTGLNWVFENTEEAIILEDDCVPHPTFFRFCEELLDYYRNEDKIMVISGTYPLLLQTPENNSYFFSAFNRCIGWATWRRAWINYDDKINNWPNLSKSDFLLKILGDEKSVKYWNIILQEVYEEKINSWGYRFQFSCWQNDGLVIIPTVNSVTNIGFGKDATNTKGPGKRNIVYPSDEIIFPLKHPKIIERDEQLDKFITKKIHRFSARDKTIRFIKKILGL